MAPPFAHELEDEQDLGPHPVRAPPISDPRDLGGIGQRAHAIRALDRETQLLVPRHVVDDAGAAKEDALREELADASECADLRQGALDRKAPQVIAIERSLERRIGDAVKAHQALRVESTSDAQSAQFLRTRKRVERTTVDREAIAVFLGQSRARRTRLSDGAAVRAPAPFTSPTMRPRGS